MRRSLFLLLLLVAIAAVAISPGAALAGGCPSAQTVMTSSDSHAVHGYMCAQDNTSGSMSIGAGKTHSYNINTNSQMFPWYYCDQASSSSVTIAHAQTWGSASFTATNWLTPSNTRHWSVGILWTAGGYSVSGFSKGCSVNSQVFNSPPAILKMSSISAANFPTGGATAGQSYPITITVSPSSATGTVAIQDNGVSIASAQLSGGTATINWTPAVDGTSKVVAVYAGDSGTTPAQGTTYTVPVSGGTGVSVNGITLMSGSTNVATASVAVTPATTAGGVALINTATKAAVGQGAIVNGVASINFQYVAGTQYSFIAKYTGSPTGQSYPVSWNSTTSKKLATGLSSTLANDLAALKGTIEGGIDPQARTITATKIGQKAFSVKCASGERLINADAMTTGPVDDIGLGSFTSGGVTVQPSVADKGHTVLAQVICRPAKARQVAVEGITYGTVGPNRIELSTAGTGFGGPGRDHLSSRAASSALWGGLGRDTLVVGGDSSTGDGGPGSDTIVAVGTGRHLLIGGEGRDTMVGSFGADLINARDGHGGDLVDCRSAQTRVIADANDVISGPCVQVDTVNGKGTIAS
jgi:hypothetical protein